MKKEIANVLERKFDEKFKHFDTITKEIFDGLNLDINNLQGKIRKQASEGKRNV